MPPLVSVLIAAWRAEATVAQAVASVLQAGWDAVEVIVAPDDGQDYRRLLSHDPRIRALPPYAGPSGAGAARNRALAAARGALVAMLDSDDAWTPGFLSVLAPVGLRAGLAFCPLRYEAPDGRLVRTVPEGGGTEVSFATFRAINGSLHGVARRDLVQPFANCFAEDVLWEMQALSAAGGTAPLCVGVAYRARLHAGSLTAGAVRESDIDASYRWLAAEIRAGRLHIGAAHRDAAAEVFEHRRAVNALFATASAASPGLNYQEFARDLAAAG